MKTFKLLAVALMLAFASSMAGQVTVNVNIGPPPAWGPSGYTNVRYYYIPDVESYYDVQTSKFIYISGNRWVRSSYLPTRYRNYDLYRGYKVVMSDYRGNTPYIHYKEYKVKYYKGYRGKEQYSNRDWDKHHGNYKEKEHHENHSQMERRSNPQSQVRHEAPNHGQLQERYTTPGPARNNDSYHGKEGDKGHGNDKGHSHGNDKKNDNKKDKR